MRVDSEDVPGAYVARCDNPNCKKRILLMWRGRNGEYCSKPCLDKIEKGDTTMKFATEAGAATAPEVDTEKPKAAKKGKAKAAAKPTAKAKSKGKAKPTPKKGKAVVTKRSAPTEGKGADVLAMIARKDGASMKELMKKTGWQPHSVRGFISTANKHGFAKIESDRSGDVLRYKSKK